MINLKVISDLKPCQDRLDNYIKFYGGKTFTKAQFMGLKNITQNDKLWVCFRLMPKKNIALAAADIAESVLHIFEEKYPNDDRPRKAIEAARSVIISPSAAYASTAAKAAYAANAAHDAAAPAYAAAAPAYAYAAAAAYTAACSAAAAYSAACSDAYAAYSAGRAAAHAYAAANDLCQEKLIRKISLKYWKDE